MKAIWTLSLFSLCAFATLVSAQPPEVAAPGPEAERAALLEEIRERIFWCDEERTSPLLVPDEVFGLLPYQELPIPEDVRDGIRMWLWFQREWKSPSGERAAECWYPGKNACRAGRSEEQTSILEEIAHGPVALLVAIEKTTRGFWPNEGIYQYNEFTPLRLLVGKDFLSQAPLSARAFLSEGGDIVVEGTRLCSKSPSHPISPRPGDTYLLVGAPDDRGIFYSRFFFRIEEGNLIPADYSALKRPAEPLTLDSISAGLGLSSVGFSSTEISSSSCSGAAAVSVQKPGGASAASQEEIRAQIQDRIVWYDQDRNYPHVIPEEVFELLPIEDLPIPEYAKIRIRRWVCLRKEDRPANEAQAPVCTYPATVTHRLKPSRRQVRLEEAMATKVATLLVRVDKVTRGIWPAMGVFQYNEVTPLRLVAGSGTKYQDPLSTRAFLSEGGRVEVDGTTLCSKSPWHETAPRPGDIYLLLGSVDIYGTFEAPLYFRIEAGNVVPASYPELEPLKEPVLLDQVLARLAKLDTSVAIQRE